MNWEEQIGVKTAQGYQIYITLSYTAYVRT